MAVDSHETISAAAAAGIAEAVIDVNVGMPRCGYSPDGAGRLAEVARDAGLSVRGVMGYEGHLMTAEAGAAAKDKQVAEVERSMAKLLAHPRSPSHRRRPFHRRGWRRGHLGPPSGPARPPPASVRFDNGPEFIAHAVADWARFNTVVTCFIDPGSPWQNAWIESFNGRLRDELLNAWHFDSLLEAQLITEDWRIDYNTHRPHSAHGDLTPNEFARACTTRNQPAVA